MDDVTNLPFLVTDSKGRKLRRVVPPDLRSLVGKTAWVERLRPMSFAELKVRVNRFSWRTDNEITRLRSSVGSVQSGGERSLAQPTDVHLRLTDDLSVKIARTYFARAERMRTMSRTYSVAHDDTVRLELLEEAGLDLAFARRAMCGEAHGDESGDGNSTFKVAWELLESNGLLPPKNARRESYPESIIGNESFQYLCRLIERADLELSSRYFDSLKERCFPRSRDEFFHELPQEPTLANRSRTAHPKSLEYLINAFHEWKLQRVSSSRLYQYRTAYRALREELGGERSIESVTRQDCQRLADLFANLPPYATQHFHGQTLRSAMEASRAKNAAYADRGKAGQKPLSVLKAIFEFAVKNEWIAKNPALLVEISIQTKEQKQYIERVSGYQPFNIDELRRIFNSPLYTGSVDDERLFNTPGLRVVKRHRYWVPLISLWTGMRMNEALQLERADLKEEAGVFYLSVTDEEEMREHFVASGKRVKNRGAVRDIPIHPTLQRLGFVEWVCARGPGRLFPEAAIRSGEKASNQFSKRFSTFLKSCDIWHPRKKVFHSFRNNFNDALRDGGVSEEMRRAINGWSKQDSMDAKYGRGYKIIKLHEEIVKARYDGLCLEHLTTGPLDEGLT